MAKLVRDTRVTILRGLWSAPAYRHVLASKPNRVTRLTVHRLVYTKVPYRYDYQTVVKPWIREDVYTWATMHASMRVQVRKSTVVQPMKARSKVKPNSFSVGLRSVVFLLIFRALSLLLHFSFHQHYHLLDVSIYRTTYYSVSSWRFFFVFNKTNEIFFKSCAKVGELPKTIELSTIIGWTIDDLVNRMC